MEWNTDVDPTAADEIAAFVARSIETKGSVLLDPQGCVTLATAWAWIRKLTADRPARHQVRLSPSAWSIRHPLDCPVWGCPFDDRMSELYDDHGDPDGVVYLELKDDLTWEVFTPATDWAVKDHADE